MKRAYLVGLAAAALFGGVFLQGCGTGGAGADGGGCAVDTDCGTGQICDTTNGVCLVSCTAGAPTECTGSETACQTVDNLAGPTCVCTSNTDCSNGGTCDTTTHTCLTSNADGGTSGGGCSATSPCAAGSYCDASGTCQTGASNCTTENTQDNCEAGQACFSDAAVSGQPVCEQISNPDGSCSISNPPDTNPSLNPVIWGVTSTGTRGPTGSETCSTIDKFSGYWYDASGQTTTGSTSATYSELVVVTSSGATTNGSGTTLATYHNTSINNDGTFTFELCSDNTGAAGITIENSSGFSNTSCIGSL